ncbi:hypothetical protein Chor_005418 [Crotalus horridus]
MHAPLVPGSMPSTTQTDLPVPLKKFYQGEPLALGITQIFIGIIGMIFGILLDIMNDYFIIYSVIKIAYWSGILYIISGSLAVAAARNPKIPLNIIKGILAVLIMFTILEFCITISVASFGCKMLCQNTFTETVVVIYQNVIPASVSSTANSQSYFRPKQKLHSGDAAAFGNFKIDDV